MSVTKIIAKIKLYLVTLNSAVASVEIFSLTCGCSPEGLDEYQYVVVYASMQIRYHTVSAETWPNAKEAL